ncbi:hypothetical protein LCM08_07120 [Salipiger pacificus]|nr:hypothetical protein [Alloyangia pacifica]
MIRRALPADAAALEAFLSQHAETSMFLRGNIAVAGLGESADRFATEVYVWSERDAIRAVFGRTRRGDVICQAQGAPTEAFRAYAEIIDTQPVTVISGPPEQTAALIAALGYGDAAFRLNQVEPLYRLELATLPDRADVIRPPGPEDASLLADWFFDYGIDIQATAANQAARQAARERAEYCIAKGSLRLLIEQGQPVAMSDFNAEVAELVQLGGVFVPRALRDGGRGRRVVQCHLLEARNRGIRTAVLFANNPAAARAYEAIGFEHIGGYRVAVLHSPQAARTPA